MHEVDGEQLVSEEAQAKSWGQWVKIMRKKKRMTGVEVAISAGWTSQRQSQIERDSSSRKDGQVSRPTIEVAEKIADALGIHRRVAIEAALRFSGANTPAVMLIDGQKQTVATMTGIRDATPAEILELGNMLGSNVTMLSGLVRRMEEGVKRIERFAERIDKAA